MASFGGQGQRAGSVKGEMMRDPRIDKLADVLVRYSVAVQKGDLVSIQGTPAGEPLIVAVYRAVLRAGGHPQVRMAPASLTELLLKEASDEQLRYISPLAQHEVETIDKRIGIWSEVNTRALTNTDAAKQAMLSAARQPIMSRFMDRAAKKELRWVGTLFPTQASAQDAGMSLGEYEDFVYGAGHLDKPDPVAVWQEIAARQEQAVALLNGKKRMRVQAANGTDLCFSVEGRRWINCCGQSNFPDGEVFTTPVEETVEGVIRFSFPVVHQGRECEGVALRFEAGQVVEATAERGEDFLREMLDQDAGARRVGEFAIGCNYDVTAFSRNTLFDEKIGGTVHLAVGASYPETGGQNKSGLHWDMVCDLRPGGSIRADDEVIYQDGQFTKVTL